MDYKKIIFWFPVIVWMGVIFYLSDQPDLKSSFPGGIDFILRKMAHITEFAVLTFLVWHALAESVSPESKKSRKLIVIASLFAFFYAISDEYHQTFIFGRVGSPKDVAIDSIGIIVAAIVVWGKKKGVNQSNF